MWGGEGGGVKVEVGFKVCPESSHIGSQEREGQTKLLALNLGVFPVIIWNSFAMASMTMST